MFLFHSSQANVIDLPYYYITLDLKDIRMHTLKSLFALVVLVFTSDLSLAAQPNWVAITPDNGDWLDTASAKHVDGKLLVWIIHNMAKAEIYPYARPGVMYGTTFYKSITELDSIDCKAGKLATLQTAFYTEENMKGEFLGSTTTPDAAVLFSYPIPGVIPPLITAVKSRG
ncbi:hypothetical protein SFSGTM_21790 [Sulfuriferula nivalis]|uniref:Surface-adhesin protein E-like domain-containing protein n=2 Tax=Sulfuriferula nivalis TaxID=2675298 RepID=A0A809RRH1_9PROT|nr:hypothetical protein SFSGTM_21790 [Sulfuriferula nivalis]